MTTCKRGHTYPNETHRTCPECHRDNGRRWIAENREKFKETQKRYYYADTERGVKRRQRYAEARPYRGIWKSIIDRCYDPDSRHYKNYGKRGIRACDRWRGPGGYENFVADVGPRPSLKHSIDRENNNGNYEPGNVSWATSAQQARNRRSNVFTTISGRTMCQLDWAREIGITPRTFRMRIEAGWAEDKLLLPSFQGKRKVIA
jgi:hypothetical protein